MTDNVGIGFKCNWNKSPDYKDHPHTEEKVLFLVGRKIEIETQWKSQNNAKLCNYKIDKIDNPPWTITLIHPVDESTYRQ